MNFSSSTSLASLFSRLLFCLSVKVTVAATSPDTRLSSAAS